MLTNQNIKLIHQYNFKSLLLPYLLVLKVKYSFEFRDIWIQQKFKKKTPPYYLNRYQQ